MDERKKIEITTVTKGKLVYAKGTFNTDNKWLILIKDTQETYSELAGFKLRINSHVSIGKCNNMVFLNEAHPGFWGYADEDYLFFEPTEEEKMEVINLLKSKGLKFVSVLNKLVRVN